MILVSCKHELTKEENKLVDSTKKWVIYTHDGRISKNRIQFSTYLKFSPNGTLVEYKFNDNSMYGKSTWNYLQYEKILNMYDYYEFKDIIVYEDSIVMKDTKDKDNIVRLVNWNKLPER